MWGFGPAALSPAPTVLLILDGWGEAAPWGGNATSLAQTQTLTSLYRQQFHTTLEASGAAVGLPGHEQGNSEVGHLTIGAGRVIVQDRTRISQSIDDGSFFRNSVLLEAMEQAKRPGRALHLIGLVSSGGVHSHIDHLHALLQLAAKQGVSSVFIHAITDGRDVLPHAAVQELDRVRHWCLELGVGAVVSVVGRYYAMDRDNHWDRVERAYRLFTEGAGTPATSVLAAIGESYARGLTDEFLEPIWLGGAVARPVRRGDSVVFFNFRQDRARQLLTAFAQPTATSFPHTVPDELLIATMIPYWIDAELPKVQVVFQPEPIGDTLGSALSQARLTQLRIAETEKYAHVTYFLNAGHEQPYPGEQRQLIESHLAGQPNRQPAMKTLEIGQAIVHALRARRHHAIIANVASPDMVGHTGDLQATVRACEVVDQMLTAVLTTVRHEQARLIITADHGNAEQLVNPTTNEADTHHTTNPVPFLFIDPLNQFVGQAHPSQTLADVAPTVLQLLNVPIPTTMTGRSLVTPAVQGAANGRS